MTRRRFGQTRKLPSGRWQARYADPEGRMSKSGDPLRHSAPHTFDSRDDAEAWLATERKLIQAGDWTPPKFRQRQRRQSETFGEYADRWLRDRRVKGRPLAGRTAEHYRKTLDRHILPTFGDTPLQYITAEQVSEWYSRTLTDRPTLRAHTYGLLHAIMATATAADGPLAGKHNPVGIRGAGQAERATQTRPATLDELATITEAMMPKYRAAVLLSAWCALRFGELTELRRKDVDLERGVIVVARAVIRVGGQPVVKATKSGSPRTVAMPPHLLPAIQDHLDRHVGAADDALLFPAADGVTHLAQSTLAKSYYPARAKAGREDLRWHDLRHSGAVMAASTGATLAEIMARLGHSTVSAAMRYQSVAAGRDAEIAAALSRLAERDD